MIGHPNKQRSYFSQIMIKGDSLLGSQIWKYYVQCYTIDPFIN